MTISKKKFFEIVDYLQEVNQFETDFQILLNKTSRDTEFIDACIFTDCTMMSYIVDLLEDEFADEGHWISYWIYDLNFGENWSSGIITYCDRDIKLKTKEDLYNLLMDNIYEKLIRTTD